MKRYVLPIIMAMSIGLALAQRGAPLHPAADSGPGVPIVKAFLDAYNKQDFATIDAMISDEIVFLDDDGHTNLGRDFVGVALQRRLSSQTKEKLVASGPITSSGTADVIWASFPYVFDRADVHRKGLITMVFKKAEARWQIVHFQFAIDQLPANSLDRR